MHQYFFWRMKLFWRMNFFGVSNFFLAYETFCIASYQNKEMLSPACHNTRFAKTNPMLGTKFTSHVFQYMADPHRNMGIRGSAPGPWVDAPLGKISPGVGFGSSLTAVNPKADPTMGFRKELYELEHPFIPNLVPRTLITPENSTNPQASFGMSARAWVCDKSTHSCTPARGAVSGMFPSKEACQKAC